MNNIKTYIKNSLKTLEYLGIVQRYFKGSGAILMLHRIAPIDEKKLPANENLKVSPEFLEHFILQAKDKGYEFISLDTLHQRLISQNLKSKFLCITLDDGYKDNLTYGLEIFEKHEIPFCIYVCTSFPQGSHDMWWFGLEDFLLQRDALNYETLIGGGGIIRAYQSL